MPMRTYAAPRDTALVSGPTYSLYLSNDLTDIDTIARLRYRVFAGEPGFTAPASAAADQRDSDRFDEYCDHLVVRHNHSGQVVGSYRLLPPPGAIAAGGPYLTTEFDITELDPIAAQTVEMGRACVDAEHRSGAVLALMWSGILTYLERSGYCYLMGATSVPICTDPTRDRPGAQVRRIRDFVRDRHAGPWQRSAASPGRTPTARGSTTSTRRRACRCRRCSAGICGWERSSVGSLPTIRTSVSPTS